MKKILFLVVCIFTFLNGIVECESGKLYIFSYKKVKLVEKQCSIDVSYPQIENSNVSDSLVKFNSLIDNYAKEKINRFKRHYNDALKKSNNVLLGPWHLKIHSDIGMNTSKMISILLDGDVFTASTHSQQFYSTFTFDLKKERRLKLSDLFKENINYLDVISKYCIDYLSRKFLPRETRQDYKVAVLDTIKNGASSKIENYQCFYLTPHGLIIVFQPYQVASYDAGTQKILIPYEELKTVLLPEYIPSKRNT